MRNVAAYGLFTKEDLPTKLNGLDILIAILLLKFLDPCTILLPLLGGCNILLPFFFRKSWGFLEMSFTPHTRTVMTMKLQESTSRNRETIWPIQSIDFQELLQQTQVSSTHIFVPQNHRAKRNPLYKRDGLGNSTSPLGGAHVGPPKPKAIRNAEKDRCGRMGHGSAMVCVSACPLQIQMQRWSKVYN